MTKPSLIEAMAQALAIENEDEKFVDEYIIKADVALKALCTYTGLTPDLLEKIRNGEAAVRGTRYVKTYSC